jgi:hypothetical protein
MQMKTEGYGAAKGKKEEERGGGTDLRWLLWRLLVVLASGGEMAVDLGGVPSLFSPLFSFSSSLFFFFTAFFPFLLVFSSFFFSVSKASPLFFVPPFVLSPYVFIGKT